MVVIVPGHVYEIQGRFKNSFQRARESTKRAGSFIKLNFPDNFTICYRLLHITVIIYSRRAVER